MSWPSDGFRSLIGSKVKVNVDENKKIKTIEPFRPQGTDITVVPYSCFNCDHITWSRDCGKYDSPLPVSQHGDEICWKEWKK